MSNNDKGYGKPPKATQFQKGQSGNPSGRKKEKNSFKSLDRALRDTLLKEVDVQIGGKRQKMLRLEAIVAVQFTSAMKGSTQAAKFLIGLAEKHVPKHQTLEELMEGRSVFEFTKEESRRFSKANILKYVESPKDVPGRSKPEYFEPGEAEQDDDESDPRPPDDECGI